MRLVHFFLPLGIAALACSSTTAPSTEAPPDGRRPTANKPPTRALSGPCIVSYNVENLFDTLDDKAKNDDDFLPEGKLHWTGDRYRHKLDQLAKAISWTTPELPAIVGLIEVENGRVLKDLVRTTPLTRGRYEVVHFESPDERGIDVALLVRQEYASIRTKKALRVPLNNDATRDVLYAELVLVDGSALHVMQVHWPSRREGQEESERKRLAAAKVVRMQVDSILARSPEAKVLVMGDFNDYPVDRSIQEGLRATCDLAAQSDLFDLMCMGRPEDEGSYQHNGKWGYLDQMIVSKGFLQGKGPQAASAQVFWDKRLLFAHPKYGLSPDKTYSRDDYKGGFSDHLPVVLQVR